MNEYVSESAAQTDKWPVPRVWLPSSRGRIKVSRVLYYLSVSSNRSKSLDHLFVCPESTLFLLLMMIAWCLPCPLDVALSLVINRELLILSRPPSIKQQKQKQQEQNFDSSICGSKSERMGFSRALGLFVLGPAPVLNGCLKVLSLYVSLFTVSLLLLHHQLHFNGVANLTALTFKVAYNIYTQIMYKYNWGWRSQSRREITVGKNKTHKSKKWREKES